jgi:REP element-mobilizing transposase RayT
LATGLSSSSADCQSAIQQVANLRYILVPTPESNPRLDRVRHALRASGVRLDANPLRSGIHTRGYLPHVKREGVSYFVTFRLSDSLPTEILTRLKAEQAQKLRVVSGAGSNVREEADREFRRDFERYLDRGIGECYLRRPEVAEIVVEALFHFHQQQYLLDEWVIMPNHLHLILWPMPNFTLSEILRSRKRQTARQANLILGRTGETFWQPESYDHWIRNDDEKARIRRYIRRNPVTAGLCASPEEWPWGSAYYQAPNVTSK